MQRETTAPRGPPPVTRFPRFARAALGAVALAVLAAASAEAIPRGFGRNKIQYETFEWRVLETENLRIHFYPQEEALARRAASIGEEACARLAADLGHRLTKRIPVVLYASHAHFRQNNVSAEIVDEGTGGFTEIFRTRVVVPYSGSEPEFRHVVQHELVHAFLFDMLYGGGLRSYFVLQSAFYIPLWFAEGMAEWYSTEWDAEGEMMIRDAAITGTLPPFDRIYGGYFVYKAGYSALAYLAQRHGKDVVPRLVRELAATRDLRAAVVNVTGEPVEAIGEAWLLDVRRATWPAIEHLGEPKRVGRIAAARGTAGGFLNGNPAISPSGKRAVFLSDRSGTPDLWAIELGDSAIAPPRVLAHGAREARFESLHPLRASAGWSSDESMVVIAARRGPRDALYVVDAHDGHVVAEMTPDLDAIERPDWSPSDARFVFTGMKDGQVDLYSLGADGRDLRRLTNDLAVERGARWSPDGSRIVYSSDAGDGETLDLFVLDAATGRRASVAAGPGDQRDPTWRGSGREIVYVSDETGTRDLMMLALEPGAVPRRMTALVGGADSPSAAWASGRLLFAAYDRGGWDLVLVDDADTLAAPDAPPIEIRANPWEGRVELIPRPPPAADSLAVAGAPAAAATPPDSAAIAAAATPPDSAAIAAAIPPRIPLEPSIHPYRSRFRMEWITGAFAYGSLGASGGLHASIADILGDHRLDAGAQLSRRFSDSDAYVRYSLLPGRLDWEATLFHVKDYLYDDRTTLGQPIGEDDDRTGFSERRWGAAGAVIYPFDTFRRATLELSATRLERTTYTDGSRAFGADLDAVDRRSSDLLLPRLAYTADNTLWGPSGPLQGARSVFSVTHAIPGRGDRLVFGSAHADARRYVRWTRSYSLAMRFLAATSFGEDPQQFQIGGPWTVRGHELRSAKGRNTAHGSIEFRYPFIERIQLGWPFRSAFGGIRGALFLDAGTAFDDPESFRFRRMHSFEETRGIRDLKIGFGTGFRARVAYLPVRVDVGWPFDGTRVGSPRWHVAFGPEL